MDLGLAGRSALVFGGSKGLGRAVAESLIAAGAMVAIVARDPERTAEVAARIGAIALPGDLTVRGAGTNLVQEAADRLGRHPDVLVTNTGGPDIGSFEATSTDQWTAAFENLFVSAAESMRAAIPGMRASGWGRIIAVGSIAAKAPPPGLILSSSLRAGLLGLVNALSKEVGSDGITVNALLPGYIKTDRLIELGVDEAAFSLRIPMGRFGHAREFGAVAAFLASTHASYVTGQAIAVDGGLLEGI